MDMLQQGGELITMTGEELSAGGESGTAALLASASTGGDTTTHQIVTETPQVIKSSLGQFVVLQQNQVCLETIYMHDFNKIQTNVQEHCFPTSGSQPRRKKSPIC